MNWMLRLIPALLLSFVSLPALAADAVFHNESLPAQNKLHALDGNLNPNEGMLEFVVRPQWDGTELGQNRFLFTTDGTPQWGGGEITVAKWWDRTALQIRVFSWEAGTIVTRTWKAGESHRITLVWSKTLGQVRAYSDGVLKSIRPFTPPTIVTSRNFVVGASLNGDSKTSAAAEIQDLRISSKATLDVSGFREIAHRGDAINALENTMDAFQAAWSRGFDVELDVMLTGDGKVVVIHDDTTQRIQGIAPTLACSAATNCHTVASTAESILRGLQLFFKGQPVPSRIPSLEEALTALPAGKRAVIEIKTPNPMLIPRLKDVLDKFPAKQIVVISFFDQQLTALKTVLGPKRSIPLYWIRQFTTSLSQDTDLRPISSIVSGTQGFDGLFMIVKAGLVLPATPASFRDLVDQFHRQNKKFYLGISHADGLQTYQAEVEPLRQLNVDSVLIDY